MLSKKWAIISYYTSFFTLVYLFTGYDAFIQKSHFNFPFYSASKCLHTSNNGILSKDPDLILEQIKNNIISGLNHFKKGNILGSIESFDEAQSLNTLKKRQPIPQRGIILYIAGMYSEAQIQLLEDIILIEKAKLNKASDLRLWRAACFNKLNMTKNSIEALDIDNIEENGLSEDDYLLNCTLNFFAGRKSLEDMIELLGNDDSKQITSRSFFGNFYLGLYYDSIFNQNLATGFLSIPAGSEKFKTDDMWHHVPKVLLSSRGYFHDNQN